MDDSVDQENAEKFFETYDQFFGAELSIPDERGRKMMARFTKLVKDYKGNP